MLCVKHNMTDSESENNTESTTDIKIHNVSYINWSKSSIGLFMLPTEVGQK